MASTWSEKNMSFPESQIIESHILAALLTYEPHTEYSPFMGADGRVYFKVYGSFQESIERLYAGESASLLEFMANLKRLRDIIFNLKFDKKFGRVKARRYG